MSQRWSPPPEPEKPPVPYRKGHRFTARRVKPPPPFLGPYATLPTDSPRHLFRQDRYASDEFLLTTTLVDYCLSMATKPLPCEPLDETAPFEVIRELTVGDGPDRGGGAQIFTCKHGHEELVAKVFDPLYYAFADNDFPYIPNDVVASAEYDFTLESAAYVQLDGRLGGGLIPKFYGSWMIDIPLKHATRSVGFVLMEHVQGVPLNKLDPKRHTQEERLRVMALAAEAQVELQYYGVIHGDVAARNIICSGPDLLSKDLRLRLIDFNVASVLPILGARVPCESEPLPDSPIYKFWNSRPCDLREWLPEGWGLLEWNKWLKETWGGSPRYKPVPEDIYAAKRQRGFRS